MTMLKLAHRSLGLYFVSLDKFFLQWVTCDDLFCSLADCLVCRLASIMGRKKFMCVLKTNLAPACLYGLLFPHSVRPFQALNSGFEGQKTFIFLVEGLQIFGNLGKNLRKYFEYLARENLTIPPGASSLAAAPSKQISTFCKFLAGIFSPLPFCNIFCFNLFCQNVSFKSREHHSSVQSVINILQLLIPFSLIYVYVYKQSRSDLSTPSGTLYIMLCLSSEGWEGKPPFLTPRRS